MDIVNIIYIFATLSKGSKALSEVLTRRDGRVVDCGGLEKR